MTSTIYNASIAAGLALIAGGVAQAVSVPAAMIVAGSLVIGLTVFGARLANRKG